MSTSESPRFFFSNTTLKEMNAGVYRAIQIKDRLTSFKDFLKKYSIPIIFVIVAIAWTVFSQESDQNESEKKSLTDNVGNIILLSGSFLLFWYVLFKVLEWMTTNSENFKRLPYTFFNDQGIKSDYGPITVPYFSAISHEFDAKVKLAESPLKFLTETLLIRNLMRHFEVMATIFALILYLSYNYCHSEKRRHTAKSKKECVWDDADLQKQPSELVIKYEDCILNKDFVKGCSDEDPNTSKGERYIGKIKCVVNSKNEIIDKGEHYWQRKFETGMSVMAGLGTAMGGLILPTLVLSVGVEKGDEYKMIKTMLQNQLNNPQIQTGEDVINYGEARATKLVQTILDKSVDSAKELMGEKTASTLATKTLGTENLSQLVDHVFSRLPWYAKGGTPKSYNMEMPDPPPPKPKTMTTEIAPVMKK